MMENELRDATRDEPDYDDYAWQFGRSLEDYGNGNWYGRLIGYSKERDSDDRLKIYTITLFGKTYTEDEFREKLDNREIVFEDFQILSYNYDAAMPDQYNPASVT